MAKTAGALSVDRRAVRRCASDPGVHLDAAAGVSRGGSGRRALGDASVCGGVHRSVVLDRHSADAAWHRAARERVWPGGPEASTSLRPAKRRACYSDATLADADRTARFIAGSYAGFRDFPMFTSYSMFYFAAASFSEMARRLDSPRTPRGFLCGDSRAIRERDDAAVAGWRRPSRTRRATTATSRRQLPIGTSPGSAIRKSRTGTASTSTTRFAAPRSWG